MTRLLCILAALTIVSAYHASAQPGGSAPRTTDDAEIYRVVLDEYYAGTATTAHLMGDSTVTDARTPESDAWLMQRLWPDFPREAIADFLEKQRLPPQPAVAAAPARPLHRISAREFREIMSGTSGWGVIARRFGGANAMVFFSRVGYDPARQWAMVGTIGSSNTSHRGTDSSVSQSGTLSLLRRGTDGQWKMYWSGMRWTNIP